MAVTSGQIIIGTTPVQIDGVSTNFHNLIIQNDSNTNKLLVGGSNVTVSNGMKLIASQTVQLQLKPLDALWIVSETEGHPVSWLRWDV